LNHIFEHTDFKHIPQEIKDHCLAAGTYSYSAAFQKNSSIFINDYSGRSLSEQEIDIVKRFSKVFEQAYVRFLDLQKAELLAREAQIEASLEKVRSHTMGMRTSEDLANVASVMFDQMRILGGDLFSFGIVLCDKHENMVEQWHSIPGAGMMAPFFVPVNLDHIHQYRYDQWKTGTELFSIVIPEDYIAHHFELMLELPSVKAVWEGIAAQGIALPPIPTWEIDYGASFRYGYLLVSALKPFEEDKIFPRFAKVFEQAYTRFLDLQKAEAQAREAQIEAALEKVRSRSLAMHKSDELIDVIEKIYIEFQQLGFDAFAADLMIFTEDSKGYDIWVSREDGTEGPYRTSGEILHHPHHIETMNAWINGDAIRIAELKGELLNSYVKMVVDASHFSKDGKNKIISLDNLIHTEVFTKHGCIRVASTEKRTEEQLDIQKRFAKVFDQAYTRFLDLQKAETQAKEARIEIALERIRARALAMHKSDELMEVAKVLREQMALLGQPELEASVVHLYQEDPDHILSWRAYRPSDSHSKIAYGHMSIPKNSCEFVREWLTKFYSEEKEYTIELSGAKQDEWYDLFFKLAPDVINSMRKEKSIHEKRYYQFSKFSGGALLMVSKQEPSIEVVYLQKRAAMVFDLAYRRFLDLQKTEAQAREAQIEAALERVRSKTMAMQRSEELDSVIKTVYAELKQLDVSFERCFIMIFDEQKGATWWMGSPDDNLFNKGFYVQYHNHPPHLAYLKGWEARQQKWEYLLGGQIKKDWDEFIFSKTELSQLPPPIIQHMSSFEHAYLAASFESFGCMTTGGAERLNEESFNVLNRFAKVFDQTYRRFLDLQKAEAQAREATIEAALERVRGKAMAMHSSKDLATTIGVFYHELEGLNLTPRRCGVGLINKETWTAEISTMNATADGQGIELVGVLDMKRHPVLTSVYNNWLTKTEYHPVLRGNEIKEYYQLVRPQVNFPDYPNDTVQYGYFFFFEEGGVYAWTEKELNEDELKIYRRFTSVLSLTYKRYKDLKDAEARAQTAIKDAALDRIRADIASMRTINDLDRITPLIWNELTVLGIPFIRCGVFIMDDEEQLIHTFLSTPDGKAIAAFHLPYDTPGPISKVIDGWRYKKIYLDHWGEEEFVQFADILMKQGALNSREQYLKTIPHGGFYLHFLPFLQGMLYVGNTTQLGEDEIVLIQHVADAFSTAYARYEDFNKLELAKQTVEKTLTDLKQAQQQLVQSEKMASLGELTAGIAHEIQNPLNFVNNFSDVSNELLEEMKQELATGNTQQAMYIANDVIDNLEKILHHGKRADAIVKGMLQHSRTSSGQKEPTDINILADEYLRLAFHGLRAKDKSFNAKFETDFDNSIGKLNVIPQDIGRVILNLINNAFYTVTEKKKQGAVGFEPTVTVTTVKDNGKIEIKVKDNGNGIPQKNLDRIFQPFFTTKPTGQGTGLGLSLAYDIVTKGHGGELKVETREGEGSEFIIQLPISKTTES
ncbi:MAG TPA: ATP-binding protein, partial [Chitinophagaceae bacterium]|nr:ATP-binding protein [Chitinophagaceae bacterium]